MASQSAAMALPRLLSRPGSCGMAIFPCGPIIQTNESFQQQPSLPRRLVVLDASWNPPTKAHSTLVTEAYRILKHDKKGDDNVVFPTASPDDRGQSTETTNEEKNELLQDQMSAEQDGILLLFATRNADKDVAASVVERRLEMMEAAAKSIYEYLNKRESLNHNDDGKQLSNTEIEAYDGRKDVANVWVGVTTHARFFEKAKSLRYHLTAGKPEVPVQMWFVLGMDTVVRLFDTRYYDNSEENMAAGLRDFFGGGARLLCADREKDGLSGGVSGKCGNSTDWEYDAFIRSNHYAYKYKTYMKPLKWGQSSSFANISSTKCRTLLQLLPSASSIANPDSDDTATYNLLSSIMDKRVLDLVLERGFYKNN